MNNTLLSFVQDLLKRFPPSYSGKKVVNDKIVFFSTYHVKMDNKKLTLISEEIIDNIHSTEDLSDNLQDAIDNEDYELADYLSKLLNDTLGDYQ